MKQIRVEKPKQRRDRAGRRRSFRWDRPVPAIVRAKALSLALPVSRPRSPRLRSRSPGLPRPQGARSHRFRRPSRRSARASDQRVAWMPR